MIQDEILADLRNIVKSYTKSACEQVRQQWASYPNDLGEAEIRDAEKTISEFVICQKIVATGQKAWLLEFGKGHEMVTDTSENPFLEDYISGGNFNRARIGEAFLILGRSKGGYYDLDGGYHYSNGTHYGEDLEDISRIHGEKYLPMPARKIVKHILEGGNNDGLIAMMNEEIQDTMMKALKKVMRQFPKRIRLL